MSIPVFIHVMANGDIWCANNTDFTPTGTVKATFKFSSDAAAQKLGTLSGTANSNLTCSGNVGKFGNEKT